MSEEQPKKAAKKKTAKKEATKPVISGKDVFYLTQTINHDVVTNMLRRSLGLEMPSHKGFHPRTPDDIEHIVKAMDAYPSDISVKSMAGYCKIWDAVISHWGQIMKLRDSGEFKSLKSLLKELAAPYKGEGTTDDTSKSIYG